MTPLYDRLFEALANEQRRQVLFALLERDRSISIDSPPDRLGDRRQAAIERQHVHYPKLADDGFVVWNQRTNTVGRGPKFQEIEPVLRLLTDNRDALPTALV